MPEPVLTVTVRVAPEPVTPAMDAPVVSVVVREKSLVSTPVTDLLKATIKPTLGAFVGFVLASIIEETNGIVIGVLVWVEVGVFVGVNVGVDVLVAVGVLVRVEVGVLVGVRVAVGVLVAVLVGVFVAVLGVELQV